jgi:hypothetical protein
MTAQNNTTSYNNNNKQKLYTKENQATRQANREPAQRKESQLTQHNNTITNKLKKQQERN